MTKEIDVERAWKDEDYRNSLTPEQLGQLPPNPAGDGELSEEDLDDISGGQSVNFRTHTPLAPQSIDISKSV